MTFHPLFDLTGKVALVVGAGQNMGKCSALGLAEAGADLLIAGRHLETLEATAEQIRKMGRKVVPVVCDVAKFDQIDAMFERLDKEFGRIDVSVHIPGHNIIGRPEDVTIEHMQNVLNTVLLGKFWCCRHAGRRMIAQGKGSIINMCSIGGVSALGRGNFAYSVAQGAVAQMTKELSTEWAGLGVRVNAVLPAEMTNVDWDKRLVANPAEREMFLRGLPIGRMGVADDIRGLVMFLASDASGFITGSLIGLDGGNLAMNGGGSHRLAKDASGRTDKAPSVGR